MKELGGSSELSPVFRKKCPLRMAMVEQDGEFRRRQRMQWREGGGRPPADASARETLETQPVASAIIDEQLESGAASVTENEESTRERVLQEAFLADRGERVDALAEIDGLNGDKDFQLRHELNHRLGAEEG